MNSLTVKIIKNLQKGLILPKDILERLLIVCVKRKGKGDEISLLNELNSDNLDEKQQELVDCLEIDA